MSDPKHCLPFLRLAETPFPTSFRWEKYQCCPLSATKIKIKSKMFVNWNLATKTAGNLFVSQCYYISYRFVR